MCYLDSFGTLLVLLVSLMSVEIDQSLDLLDLTQTEKDINFFK